MYLEANLRRVGDRGSSSGRCNDHRSVAVQRVLPPEHSTWNGVDAVADCVEVGLFIDTDIGSLAHVVTGRAVEGPLPWLGEEHLDVRQVLQLAPAGHLPALILGEF